MAIFTQEHKFFAIFVVILQFDLTIVSTGLTYLRIQRDCCTKFHSTVLGRYQYFYFRIYFLRLFFTVDITQFT